MGFTDPNGIYVRVHELSNAELEAYRSLRSEATDRMKGLYQYFAFVWAVTIGSLVAAFAVNLQVTLVMAPALLLLLMIGYGELEWLGKLHRILSLLEREGQMEYSIHAQYPDPGRLPGVLLMFGSALGFVVLFVGTFLSVAWSELGGFSPRWDASLLATLGLGAFLIVYGLKHPVRGARDPRIGGHPAA